MGTLDRNSGSDQPLRVGDALKSDRLGRRGFAQEAANALGRVSAGAGYTISIEGPWGSGKSSVLAMIEELLKFREGPLPVVVHFNPWLVGDREFLLRQFLSGMAAAVKLSDHSKDAVNVAKEIKGYLKIFDVIKFIPGAEPWASIIKSVFKAVGEGAGAIGDAKSQDIEGQKLRLENALRQFSRPVIVFIDDIDRLYPSEVFEMVRIIKAIGDLPNVGYVLAVDPAYVAKALASLNVPNADTYLDKVVQHRLAIPSLSFSAKLQLMNGALDEMPVEATEMHSQEARKRFGSLYFSGLRELLDQPRDFVRVFNVVRTLEPQLRGEIVFADILGLAALSVKSSPVFELLRKSPRLFVGRLSKGDILLADADKLLEQGAEARDAALNACSSPGATKGLLYFLFPKVARADGAHSLDTSEQVKGRLADPARLLIALQLGVTTFDVSLRSVHRYLLYPSERNAIVMALTSENCFEFLSLLRDVGGSMAHVYNQELVELFIDVARLADHPVFVANVRNRLDVFVPSPENLSIAALDAMATGLEDNIARELGRAIANDADALSVATEIIAHSCGLSSSGRSRLVVPAKALRATLASFARNVENAAAQNGLFNRSNPGYVLRTLARATRRKAPKVFKALQLSEPNLDAFADAILYSSFDTHKGRAYSLPTETNLLDAFVSLRSLEAHAKKRLTDSSMDYPARAAWRSIVEKQELYGVDGTKCDR